jgi:hypothetical protein
MRRKKMPVINTIEKTRDIISRVFDGATHVEKENNMIKALLPKMSKQDAEGVLETMTRELREKPYCVNSITLKFQNSDIDPRGLYSDTIHWSKFRTDHPLNQGRLFVDPSNKVWNTEFTMGVR